MVSRSTPPRYRRTTSSSLDNETRFDAGISVQACEHEPVACGPMADLASRIDELWEHRAELPAGDAEADATVSAAVDLLDRGEARVAEIVDDEVVVHQWLKKAILLL